MLFRSETIRVATNRLGEPIGRHGLATWVLTLFMVVLFATCLFFVASARYAKKETVPGLIVPASGVARIAPLRPAIVKKIHAGDGKVVGEGDTLFSLTYDSVLEDGKAFADQLTSVAAAQRRTTEKQVSIKKQQIVQSRLQLEARLAGLRADEKQMAAQEALQRERVQLLEKTLASTRSLHEQRFVSAIQLRQREDDLIQARLNLVQITQAVAKTQSQIREAVAELSGFDIALAEADASLELSRAQYDEKRLDVMSSQAANLVAPRPGRLTAVQVREGDLVSAGQTLAHIVPDDKRARQQVHLWVPSRAIGFVERGTPVRLMFDAFPYQTFGVGKGKVIEIASAPIMPAEVPMPIPDGEQMYRVVVALDDDGLRAYGRDWPLSPGMRLTADLVLMEKSLLDWLLEPLMAAKRIADIG